MLHLFELNIFANIVCCVTMRSIFLFDLSLPSSHIFSTDDYILLNGVSKQVITQILFLRKYKIISIRYASIFYILKDNGTKRNKSSFRRVQGKNYLF